MTVLQYWQSHTIQSIIESNRGRNSGYEAPLASFREAITRCYELASTVIHVDSKSPSRLYRLQVGNQILEGTKIYQVMGQQIRLLCQKFEAALQENEKKNKELAGQQLAGRQDL